MNIVHGLKMFALCSFSFSLDGFATNDLAFFWDDTQNISAIRVNEDLEMPDFVLSNHEARYCNRTTATGMNDFHWKRHS